MSNAGQGAVQIGQVGGNVTVHQYISTGTAANDDAPSLPEVLEMYKRCLTRAERKGTDEFMHREFGTSTIVSLGVGERIRLMSYMRACLRNRASDARRNTRSK